MVRKKRSKSEAGRREKRLPIRYSKNETWYKMLDELEKEQNTVKADLIREAVKHYYNLVTKSWTDIHREIVEESRRKYIEGLKANGYNIHDVTDIFVPGKKEGYVYLIRKLGTSELRLIMPPPFLGYGALSLETKEIQLVPDIVSQKEAREKDIATIVKKIRDYEETHRGTLMISFGFPEYITELVRYVTAHSIWSEVMWGPVPPSEDVGKQKTVVFKDQDKIRTLAQDVANDFAKFAETPPKNLKTSFLWYEEPERWSNIVGLAIFFPASVRSKLSYIFNREPEKLDSKVVKPLNRWIEYLASEEKTDFSFTMNF